MILLPGLASVHAAPQGQPSRADHDSPGLEQPALLATLRIEDADHAGGQWIVVENPLHGPIEVLISETSPQGTQHRLQTDPPLPVRGVVPAMTRRILARTGSPQGQPRLRLVAIPGRPGGRASDVEYGLPLQDAALRVTQGWNGAGSHATPEHRYAVDFAAPVGTPVLAARDGVVMQVESGFADRLPGLGRRPGDDDIERANLVRILHDDGSMALYAHLQRDGVQVLPGQRVRRGQAIARSGNSGFSLGPHLHFAVQLNRGLQLESVPFRMFGPGGVLRFSPGTTQDTDATPPSP
ncbi:M23 family metallopeptidase [Luteimonas sp. RIT-PG2_3]